MSGFKIIFIGLIFLGIGLIVLGALGFLYYDQCDNPNQIAESMTESAAGEGSPIPVSAASLLGGFLTLLAGALCPILGVLHVFLPFWLWVIAGVALAVIGFFLSIIL